MSSLNFTWIKVQNITADSATIQWRTETPVLSSIEYGQHNSPYEVSDGVNEDYSLDHSYMPEQHGFSYWPGTTYHFRVKIRDRIGNSTVSDDKTFQTPVAVVTTGNGTFTATRLFVGQFGNTKYNLKLGDPDGVQSFVVKKVNGTTFSDYGALTVWGGSPSCLKSLDSGTVTLESSDFPIVVQVTDCSGQNSSIQADMPTQ